MNGAMVHGIRSTGASTAALVSVAAGGIDLYWCVIALPLYAVKLIRIDRDAGPYAWDVCVSATKLGFATR